MRHRQPGGQLGRPPPPLTSLRQTAPDATQPQVTGRPRPPELLGATRRRSGSSRRRSCRTICAKCPDRSASRLPGPSPDHLAGRLRPFRPSGSVLRTGQRPVLGPPPESRWASASRTAAMLNRPAGRVKGAARNPELFHHIFPVVPSLGRHLHRSSPACRRALAMQLPTVPWGSGALGAQPAAQDDGHGGAVQKLVTPCAPMAGLASLMRGIG